MELRVSRQSERTYAERALNAGASGYWMKNSSAEELMRALETVLTGEVYVSPVITSLAMHRFAGRRAIAHAPDILSNREMAVFSLIGAGLGVGRADGLWVGARAHLPCFVCRSSS